MDTTKLLSSLSLNENESRVYLACLQLQTASASAVARHARMHRTYIYDIADILVSRGFLHKTKRNNVLHFSATDPETIIKREEDRLDSLKKTLPELKALANAQKDKPRILYYEGADWDERLIEDVRMHEDEILVFTSEDFYTTDDGRHQQTNINRRIWSNTRCRAIAAHSEHSIRSQKRDPEEARETHLLSAEIFDAKTMIGIYKNQTIVMNYKKAFGFIVDDADLANTVKNLFGILWTYPQK